jgi:hypothetical protein
LHPRHILKLKNVNYQTSNLLAHIKGLRVETKTAIEIVGALANGLNPRTGEELSARSLCRNPQTVQALQFALQALEKSMDINGGQQQPTNAGKLWDPDEDDLLVAEFQSGKTVTQLATIFGRSVYAISCRLEIHRSVNPSLRHVKDYVI